MRIVSLLPSATEIVCALDAGRDLVGVSHECDHPAEVRGLPVLTRARIDAKGTSAEIDRAVRESLVENALSLYAVDAEALARLAPDVIVTQDLCEVCAVSLDDVRAAVARIAHRDDVAIVSLAPTKLDQVLAGIDQVAEAIGRVGAGRLVRGMLTARIERTTSKARKLTRRPRVVTIEWLEPLMLGGTWMPELIDRAGGIPVGVTTGAPAPTVTPEALAALQPHVVLLKPCGFTIERTLEERALIERNILSVLPETTRVYVSDGNAYFNRPGPRLVESHEILAACTHPGVFEHLANRHAGAIVRLR